MHPTNVPILLGLFVRSSGVNISHYSLPNGYGIVSKFTEFSEKFLVLRSQKIEKIATFEEKNEKKSRFPKSFWINTSFQ